MIDRRLDLDGFAQELAMLEGFPRTKRGKEIVAFMENLETFGIKQDRAQELLAGKFPLHISGDVDPERFIEIRELNGKSPTELYELKATIDSERDKVRDVANQLEAASGIISALALIATV